MVIYSPGVNTTSCIDGAISLYRRLKAEISGKGLVFQERVEKRRNYPLSVVLLENRNRGTFEVKWVASLVSGTVPNGRWKLTVGALIHSASITKKHAIVIRPRISGTKT